YYSITRKVRNVSYRSLSYKTVENLYYEMWSKWRLVNHNCNHWAGDFWRKLMNA
ncbi:hypothetical protein AAVH_40998, partial [Aphelenchoides avenae]